MLVGMGCSVRVPVFSAPGILSRWVDVNTEGYSAWISPHHDVWRKEGVYDITAAGKPVLLRPSHFAANAQGQTVDFLVDFMVPFFQRFSNVIRTAHPESVIFLEPFINPQNISAQKAPSSLSSTGYYAWAPHYYDDLVLVMKTMRPWFTWDTIEDTLVLTSKSADDAVARSLAHVAASGATLGGADSNGAPVLLGETGVPMDMDRWRGKHTTAAAYISGDFSAQILALDRTMRGIERVLLSVTLWTYTASNSNARGDGWNDEDLSLFSRDQQHVRAEFDLHAGGRALQAAVRPYPMKICGEPVRLRFDPLHRKRPFFFEFISGTKDVPSHAPTIIFVPGYQYPYGIHCNVSDGTFYYDAKNHWLSYLHDTKERMHTISIFAAWPQQ
jgi:hypothetical protein